MSSVVAGVADLARALRRRGVELIGGPARARVVLVLGGALGLQGADMGAVTATANNLEQIFRISNTGIGLLVSVTGFAGA